MSEETKSVQLEKIVVTPEMEAAGFRVLRGSGIADGYWEGDIQLLCEIFRAMFALSPQTLFRDVSLSPEKPKTDCIG